MRPAPGTIVAAVLLPPLGVHLAGGGPRAFATAAALTVAGYLPGIAYALWHVLHRELAPGPIAA